MQVNNAFVRNPLYP